MGTAGSFSTDFVIKLHDSTTGPADGIAFVLQSEGDNTSGGFGGGMGYFNYTDSVAVEFDTFQNTENGDPDANHVEVASTSAGTRTTLGRAAPGFSLYGNLDVHGWVDYDAVGHRIRVYTSQAATKPASPLIDVALDLTSVIGPSTFVGFTASTGAQNSVHDLLSWRLTGQIDDPCTGPGVILGTAGNDVLKGTTGDHVTAGSAAGTGSPAAAEATGSTGGDGNDNLDGGAGARTLSSVAPARTWSRTPADEPVAVDLEDVLATDGQRARATTSGATWRPSSAAAAPMCSAEARHGTFSTGVPTDALEGRGGIDAATYATRTAAQPVTIANDGSARVAALSTAPATRSWRTSRT